MADASQHFATPPMYPPPGFDDRSNDMRIGEHAGQMPAHSPSSIPSSLSSSPSIMYPTNNSMAKIDLTPSPSNAFPLSTPFAHDHGLPPQGHPGTHALTLNPAQLSSSVGPSRVLTRRQARAAQQALQLSGVAPARSVTLSGQVQNHQVFDNSLFLLHGQSPPRSPVRLPGQGKYSFHHSGSPDLFIPNDTISLSSVQGSHPSTPASTSSGFTNYGFHPYSHSRSTSNSSIPRCASPAMSLISVAASSCSSIPAPPSAAENPANSQFRRKYRGKSRLLNIDRKAICEYARQNPTLRQEDIAARWQIERSTVSKILKNKNKWLNVAHQDEMKPARHRLSKFPAIEKELHSWLVQCRESNIAISDNMIRTKAREVAKQLCVSEDKFKASAGWVENFKHRHGVKKGVWDPKAARQNLESFEGGSRAGSPEFEEEDEFDEEPPAPTGSTNILKDEVSPVPISPMENTAQGSDTSSHGFMTPLGEQSAQWSDHTQSGLVVQPSATPAVGSASPPSVDLDHGAQVQQAALNYMNEQMHHDPSMQSAQSMAASTPHNVMHDLSQMHGDMHYDTDGVFFQNTDDTSRAAPVSAAEANEAMKKVLRYIEGQPEGFITPHERMLLTGLRQLFTVGNC